MQLELDFVLGANTDIRELKNCNNDILADDHLNVVLQERHEIVAEYSNV